MRIGSLLKLIVFASIVSVAIWVVWNGYCVKRCESAHTEANRLAEHGDHKKALRTLDAADCTCDCGRFTKGDEPPEMSSARHWLGLLRAKSGEAAAAEITQSAEGPILQELDGE